MHTYIHTCTYIHIYIHRPTFYVNVMQKFHTRVIWNTLNWIICPDNTLPEFNSINLFYN